MRSLGWVLIQYNRHPLGRDQNRDIHSGKAMWRHREKAAFFRPRRNHHANTFIFDFQTTIAKKESSVVYVTPCIVLCYDGPGKLIPGFGLPIWEEMPPCLFPSYMSVTEQMMVMVTVRGKLKEGRTNIFQIIMLNLKLLRHLNFFQS